MGATCGFLMYLADSAGYLGYVGLILAKKFLPVPDEPLVSFTLLCGWVGVLGMLCLFWHKGPINMLGCKPTTSIIMTGSPSSTYPGKLVLFHGPEQSP